MKNSKTFALSLVYCLVFLIVLNTVVSGQQQKGWSKTDEDKKELKKFKHNYFHSLGFTPLLNFLTFNYKYYNEYDEVEVLETVKQFSLVSLQYDARYNLLNYHDFFSISLNISPMVGMIPSMDVGIYTQLPIGIDFNFFNHSTFNNVNDIGFSIGGGISLQNVKNADYNMTEPAKWNEIYGRFLFKYRKYKFKAVNSFNTKANRNYYSYLGIQYGRGSNELVINNVTEQVNNHSLKIVFGKILGY